MFDFLSKYARRLKNYAQNDPYFSIQEVNYAEKTRCIIVAKLAGRAVFPKFCPKELCEKRLDVLNQFSEQEQTIIHRLATGEVIDFAPYQNQHSKTLILTSFTRGTGGSERLAYVYCVQSGRYFLKTANDILRECSVDRFSHQDLTDIAYQAGMESTTIHSSLENEAY